MTRSPEALSELHARCFSTPRAWTAAEFRDLLEQPNVVLLETPESFALARLAADEAELLTIAVEPDRRQKGHGKHLLQQLEANVAARGATVMILEVAEDNTAARALYAAAGYTEIATRPRYYIRPDGHSVSAVVMQRQLT